MITYEKDFEKLQGIDRENYFKVYLELGKKMFSECTIPTVADFANLDNEDSYNKITNISNFTNNTEDILNSIKKKDAKYTEEESNKFMNSVIASNVTDITVSGYFYKKLISSCDNMRIIGEDCRSKGEKFVLPIDEDTYNYKVKFRNIVEIGGHTESFSEFKKKTTGMSEVHVRTFLTCKTDKTHRCFCKACAGAYKRSSEDYFMPKDIGIYATLMITEHATQASLDSMNKGVSKSVNAVIESKLDKNGYPTYKDIKKKIEEIIDDIGNIGVMSRYYEIALLSRFYMNPDGTFFVSPLQTSFLKQGDKLGSFIYKPTEKNFLGLLGSKNISADSMKSKIMMDIYD